MLRNRLIVAALWILSLVGISFYGGPVSYGFFAVITLIPLISLLYLLLVLARFKIYQRFESKDLVADHVVPFFFTLQNEDWFAFAGVRVKFHSDHSSIEGLSDDIEYELLPQTKITKETELICKYRGEYNVGISSVVLRDYLCLFKITYKNREPLRAAVLPNIIRLEDLRSVNIDTLSDREALTDLTTPDVEIRDYIPGDDIRRINYKQSARLDKLMIRKFTGEEKEGVGIILDPHRISEDENVFLPVENRMLEIVIAVSLFLSEKNIPVSAYFLKNDPVERSVDSGPSFNDLYGDMSSVSFDTSKDRALFYQRLRNTFPVMTKKIMFIVTAVLDEEVLEFSRVLNENRTDVIIYLVTGENDSDAPDVNIYPHTKLFKIPAGERINDRVFL